MQEKVIVRVDAELKDLIPNFLANRQKDIRALENAIAGSDFETARIIGHNMKGVGGGYGFDNITTLGISLEIAAKNKSNEDIAALLASLRIYLDSVEIVYV